MVIRIQTRENEPVEKALRRLRKLCNNEGITRTTKAKAYFEKPSERRRRDARERKKAIRLSMRAKRQDIQKLLNRRRKARKNARAAARERENVLEQQAQQEQNAPQVESQVTPTTPPEANTPPTTPSTPDTPAQVGES